VVLALDAEGQVLASSERRIENVVPAELFLELLASSMADGASGTDLEMTLRLTPELADTLAAAIRSTESGARRRSR
jgi:hypothetical protein